VENNNQKKEFENLIAVVKGCGNALFLFGLFFVCLRATAGSEARQAQRLAPCGLHACYLCIVFVSSFHFVTEIATTTSATKTADQSRAMRGQRTRRLPTHAGHNGFFPLPFFLWLFFVGVFRKTYQNKSFGFTSNSLQICKNISSEMLFFPFSIS